MHVIVSNFIPLIKKMAIIHDKNIIYFNLKRNVFRKNLHVIKISVGGKICQIKSVLPAQINLIQ